MGLVVRHLDYQRDADIIITWLPDLYGANFPDFSARPEFLARRRQSLREAVRHPAQTVLVAEDGLGPVGFIWLTLEVDSGGHRQGEVAAVYVAPRARRRGAGRLLMAEAEVTLRLWGCDRLHLMVTATNTAAVRMYEDMGFVVTRYQMEKQIRDR